MATVAAAANVGIHERITHHFGIINKCIWCAYAHGELIEEGAIEKTNTHRWDNIIHI